MYYNISFTAAKIEYSFDIRKSYAYFFYLNCKNNAVLYCYIQKIIVSLHHKTEKQ